MATALEHGHCTGAWPLPAHKHGYCTRAWPLHTSMATAHEHGHCTGAWPLHTSTATAHEYGHCTRAWPLHTSMATAHEHGHLERMCTPVMIMRCDGPQGRDTSISSKCYVIVSERTCTLRTIMRCNGPRAWPLHTIMATACTSPNTLALFPGLQSPDLRIMRWTISESGCVCKHHLEAKTCVLIYLLSAYS